MRIGNTFVLLFVSLIGSNAVAAPTDELAALRAEVTRLTERLAVLEARTRPIVDELTVTSAAPSGTPSANTELDWARKVKLKGDLRYRYDEIDEQGDPDRPRNRIRARLGASAMLSDTVDVHLQLATGGSDPRSTNQTLGETFTTKDIGINLAYFDWEAMGGVHALGGKMRHPLHRPGDSRFLDPDINPEGLALTWAGGPFFATAFYFIAAERASDDETYELGGQLGFVTEIMRDAALTAGVTYHNWFEVEGFAPFFQGNPNGNSVDAAGNALFDYDLVDVFAELSVPVFDLPLSVYGQYGLNTQADSEDTAYIAGFLIGKADAPRKWELGYAYADHERDSLFAQVVDSDFAGGETAARGHILRGGLGITKNVIANLAYYATEVDVDLPTRHDSDRLMLDLNFKF